MVSSVTRDMQFESAHCSEVNNNLNNLKLTAMKSYKKFTIETLYSVSNDGGHHLTTNKSEATIFFLRKDAEHQGASYSNFTLEEQECGYIVVVKSKRFL